MTKINLMDNLDIVKVGSVISLHNELNDISVVVASYDKSIKKIEFENGTVLMTEYITPDLYYDFKLEVD